MGNALSSSMSLDSTDFKTGISAANRELRLLDSQFKAGVAAMGDWSKSSTGLEQRVSMLNQSIGVQQGKVAALQAEYERVAAEKGATSRAAQELQIQLNRETEKLGKMTHELGQTENALSEMGQESGDTAKETQKVGNEAKKAEKDVKSFGDRLKEIGKGVGTTLAGVGKVIAGIGAAAVGAVGGLSAVMVKSADAAGELVDMSLKTGLSVTTLQELQYVGDQVGVDLEKITGGLARFTNAIEAAATGTGPLAEDMSTLGISVFDANGSLRDSREVYFEAIEALGQMDNATQREIVAQNLFGKSFQELMPLINAGKDELAGLTEEAHRNGAVMSEEAVKGLEAWGDELAGLKGSLKGLAGTLSAAFLPAFSGMTGVAKGWMSELAGILSGSNGDLKSIGPKLSNFLARIFSDIGARAPGMIEMGVGLVESLLTALMTAMPTLIPAVTKIGNTLVEAFGKMAPMLIKAAPGIILGLVGGLVQMLPKVMEAGTKVLTALVEGIGKMLPQLITAAVQMVATLISGIAQALPQLMRMIAEIIPQVVVTLIQNLPLLIGAALELIAALVDGLAAALPILIGYGPEILIALVSAVISALPIIVKAGYELIKALVTGIVGEYVALWDAGVEAVDKLVNGIGSLISKMPPKGRELIENLINGLKSAVIGLAQVGKNIVDSLWQGIVSNWGALVANIKAKLSSLFSGLGGLFGFGGGGSSGGGGGGGSFQSTPPAIEATSEEQTNSEQLLVRSVSANQLNSMISEAVNPSFLNGLSSIDYSLRNAIGSLSPYIQESLGGLRLTPAAASVGSSQQIAERIVTINVNPSEPIDYELLANKVARKVTEGW